MDRTLTKMYSGCTPNFSLFRNVKLLFLLLFLCSTTGAYASGPLNYEIEGAGIGSQGTYLIKIWVVSKKNKPNINLIKKCAVHGVLFRGFSNENKRGGQKPLAGMASVEQQNASYFEDFFRDEGGYRNFVTMVSESYEVVKTKKKEYRIGSVLSVSTDLLRKHLTDAGVMKGMNSGF